MPGINVLERGITEMTKSFYNSFGKVNGKLINV